MIVDSSALLAILQEEPEADRFTLALTRDPYCAISVANWLELSMVAFQRGGEDGVRDVDCARRRIAIAQNGASRSPISADADHTKRRMPITDSG